MSYPQTFAPSRCAVAIACKPATPAPRTNTLAGGTVPAAVISIGKYLPSRPAATRAALYPATDAWEDNASSFWARLMRGISSIANPVTRRSARHAITGPAVAG